MKFTRFFILMLALTLLFGGACAESILPAVTPAETQEPAETTEAAAVTAPSYGAMANVAEDEVIREEDGTMVTYEHVTAEGYNRFGEYLGRRGYSLIGTETEGERTAYLISDGQAEMVLSYDAAAQRMYIAYPRGVEFEQARFPGYTALTVGETVHISGLGDFTFTQFDLDNPYRVAGMADIGIPELITYYDHDGQYTTPKKVATFLGFTCYNTTDRALLFSDNGNDLFTATVVYTNEYNTYSFEPYALGGFSRKAEAFLSGYLSKYDRDYYDYAMAVPLKSLTESGRCVAFDLPEGVRTSAGGSIHILIDFPNGEKYVIPIRENGETGTGAAEGANDDEAAAAQEALNAQLAAVTLEPGGAQAVGQETAQAEAHAANTCPDCMGGRCTMCGGRGYRECELCMGLGICGVCFGRPRDYVPSYDGTGGSDVTCAGCHGSGRCEYCGGTGRQVCMWCDGGVCRTCHGLAVSGAD